MSYYNPIRVRFKDTSLLIIVEIFAGSTMFRDTFYTIPIDVYDNMKLVKDHKMIV